MPPKKDNRITVNLTEKAMLYLKTMGYVDGRKRATKKNISAFMSAMICKYVDAKGESNEDITAAKRRALIDHMQEITQERDKLEKEISEIAKEVGRLNQIIMPESEVF